MDEITIEKRSNLPEKTADQTNSDYKSDRIPKEACYDTFQKKDETKDIDCLSEGSDASSIKTNYSVTKPDSKFTHAYFNLTKSYLGMGPLTITSAMKNSGLGFGLIGIFSCGLLALYGINIMVLARRKVLKDQFNEEDNYLPGEENAPHREIREEDLQQNEDDDQDIHPLRLSQSSGAYTDMVVQSRHIIKTYSDLGRNLFGDIGYYLITCVIFIQQLIVVISYFYYLNQYFPSYIVLLGITPVCMFWDLKKISYISFFSLACVLSAMILIVITSFMNISHEPKTNLEYFNFLHFPLFFGIWVYQYEGNVGWLQIENSMKKPKEFKKVSSYGMATIIFFKILLAWVTYIAFVDTVDDIIIDRLPGHTLRGFLGIMYCFVVIGSMPIQLNPISDTLYRTTLLDDYIPIFRTNPTSKYYIGALVSLIFCAAIAMVIPNLHTLFNIAGGIVGILTIIVFPVMFYNQAYKDEISWKRWFVHLLLAVVVSISGIASTVYTLLD